MLRRLNKWQPFHQDRKEKQRKTQSTSLVPPGGEICQHGGQATVSPHPSRLPLRGVTRLGARRAPKACLAPRTRWSQRRNAQSHGEPSAFPAWGVQGPLMKKLDRSVAAQSGRQRGQPCCRLLGLGWFLVSNSPSLSLASTEEGPFFSEVHQLIQWGGVRTRGGTRNEENHPPPITGNRTPAPPPMSLQPGRRDQRDWWLKSPGGVALPLWASFPHFIERITVSFL